MTIDTRLITADELLQMPDTGARLELILGELVRMSPAGYQHGRLIMNIATPLDQYVREHQLGVVCAAETGFLLARDPDTVRAADVAFIARAQIQPGIAVEGYWPGAPTLAVEVVSPHDLYTEVDEKVTSWLDAGTSMVVIVNPRKQTTTVYRALNTFLVLREGDVLDGGDIVPGWRLPLAKIFTLQP
jgi:Uma2 family endonuclease